MVARRRLRILFISDVYFPRINGVSTSIQTFRRELEALGHDTKLVAPAYPVPHDDDRGIYRVASRYVPLDPEDRAMRWSALRRLRNVLADGPFDLVHIQTPFFAHYAGVKLARAWSIPCVTTYHTLFEEYLAHYVPFIPKRALRAAARAFSRRQCSDVDAVIVPSIAMRETLERYGVSTRTEIIPTGIPLRDFARGDGAQFRAHHGIAPGRPMLLFVGRVAYEKNIDFLLRVVGQVMRAIPDVLLAISGEGPALEHLRRLTMESGLGNNVLFVGYLDRTTALADCYRAADIFVFASRTETQGLVLLEAMALGLPVVSTAVMGTRDIVGAGKGALVPQDDEHDFASKVVALLRDPLLRARIGAEALEYARSWGAPATARRLESMYFNLRGEPG
jgi:glycosyltransferase involved in cell wall biosynthesis